MNGLRPLVITPPQKDALRRQVSRHEGAISFREEPALASRVAALGIQQEVGTENDDLARFVFDPDENVLIPRSQLRADLVAYGSEIGVRLWAEGNRRLELRFPGIRALFHPASAPDELVVFPSVVAQFLQTQRVEAVVVVPWALNTVFGGFHPADGFYQTNMWELVNVDVVRYAALLERRQLAFLGTHDLLAHIAGTRGEAWDELEVLAKRVRETVEAYLAGVVSPNIASLILPYVAGIMLDDLSQPPCYGAESRRYVLDATLRALDGNLLSPALPRQLLSFPERYSRLISLARFGEDTAVQEQSPALVRDLVAEIKCLMW